MDVDEWELVLMCAVCRSQHNVKVFVDWKFDQNGDPMIDVAYFNMMFLKPENFGHPNLRRLPLLTGMATNASNRQSIWTGVRYVLLQLAA